VWALAKLCNGAGIGVLQITCQVYVMEICPNRIRGGMVTFQAVWWVVLVRSLPTPISAPRSNQ
jgi:hypothetical protein